MRRRRLWPRPSSTPPPSPCGSTPCAWPGRRTWSGCMRPGTRPFRPGTPPRGPSITARAEAPLPGAAEGWYQVQDEASMLIAHLLAPQGGERILDACAAPGGKTTHIAALAGNSAPILALDLHPKRLELVSEGTRAARLRGGRNPTLGPHDPALLSGTGLLRPGAGRRALQRPGGAAAKSRDPLAAPRGRPAGDGREAVGHSGRT